MIRKMRGGSYVLFVMFMICVSVLLSASWGGYILKTKKTSSSGCGCHGPLDNSVSVQIIGPDTVVAGSVSDYQVIITGGPLKGGGTDIAVMDGTLIAGPGLYEEMNELTHSQPMLPANGKVTFTFQFSAPVDRGIDTIYANGNSINGDGDNTGDSWNFAPNKAVVILPQANAVHDMAFGKREFSLAQNYPNPFNPSTKIRFTLPQSESIVLRVFDAHGVCVKTLAEGFFSEGSHELSFQNTSLPSGIYLYELQAGASSITRKMLLLK